MTRHGIEHLRDNLVSVLATVARGEVVTVTRRGVAVAEIHPVGGARTCPATCGWCTNFGGERGGYTCSAPVAAEWFAAFLDPVTGILNCAAEDCPGFRSRRAAG